MSLTLATAATDYPISVAEAASQMNITGSDDDSFLESLIAGVTAYFDGNNGILGRALLTQTWDLKLDHFPYSDDDAICIPLPPLQSVTYIKYLDSDGTLQTWGSSNYVVDSANQPGRVYLAYNQSWPDTRDIRDAVTIRFVCGYGTAASIPKDIKQCLLGMVSHWYENREAVSMKQAVEVPFFAQAIIDRYKIRAV